MYSILSHETGCGTGFQTFRWKTGPEITIGKNARQNETRATVPMKRIG